MSEEKKPTNKLAIYLLKEGIVNTDQIFENVVEPIDFGNNRKLYVNPSNNRTPDWINKFLGTSGNNLTSLRVFTAAAKAVLIVENVSGRTFAICFGYGKHMLKPNAIEQRFGLKTTLNIVDQNNIRSIDKTSLESVPKHSKEQISQDGDKESFGLDIEQDLVRSISGKPKSGLEQFGKIVSGKEAFYVTSKTDISNIRELLTSCYERYKSDDYKTNFDWIDQIKEIDDKEIVEKLNNLTIEKVLKNEREKIWVATPEQIDWSDIDGFALKKYREDDELSEDISLTKIKDEIGEERFDIQHLKQTKVLAISSESNQIKHAWRAFDCLYAEIRDSNSTYLLTNGKWYEIDKSFVESVDKGFKRIPRSSLAFPDYEAVHDNEAGYNKFLTEKLNGTCMDAKNIFYGGGHSQIEFCDVYTANKEVIHIKHYSGSSTLSHLFAQGSVSGELLKNDPEFRKLVNLKLADEFKLQNPEGRYLPSGQKIIFGIITRNPEAFDLPFFSKVSLRNANRLLTGFEFSVEIAAIRNTVSET